jgi:hypothetical protein
MQLAIKVRNTDESSNLLVTLRKLETRAELANLDPRFQVFVYRVKEIVLGNIKVEIPFRTGILRSSANVEAGRVGAASYRLDYSPIRPVDYESYIVQGTKPHIITPEFQKALSFIFNGQNVLVRKVNHPGIKPNDYIARGFDKSKPAIRKELNMWGMNFFR